MKRVYQSCADRITNLPADVIQRILVSLPIKDAAKTSILSSKWRHNWKSIPQLVFDGRFARINRVSESQSDLRSKLTMLNIYKALLVHDGPITKFVLSIPGLNFCDLIDHIVLYFANKGVQDFTLMFDSRIFDTSERSTDDYQMHSSLFSALHLKSLKLRSCELMPPSWFDGFSKLTHLRLGEVTLPSDFFENFLTKCPMLEYLRVIDCEGPAVELEIVAPSLKSFHYAGSLRVISFKCTPLLTFVALYTVDTETHDMAAFFASIPTLKQLHASAAFLNKLAAGNGNVPTKFPSPMHGLEVFDMIDLDFHNLEMEHVFVCLIMSAPNLRRLAIRLDPCHLDDPPVNNEVSSTGKLLEADDCSGSSKCLQQLREFTIEDSCGTQVELDILRFVLATAPLLRRISIRPSHQLSSKKAMKFTVEAMRYKRVSEEAELVYHWVDKNT
ncbi:unnamed protein product [Linum trigynum]|uniref:F-box domain-containing protein n=1 Tax=Linum trigynum TaxID=586398 RepID=A0AAV2GFD7_9ROSI